MVVHAKEAATNLVADESRNQPKEVIQIENIFAWLFTELIGQRDDFRSCSLTPNENKR